MPLTINGNDIEFSGNIKVVNGFNPDTGVAYLILTPDGGVGALPFLAQGLPGLPPVFDSISVVEVAPATPLPTPNPVVTTISPGGNGVASHLALTFYIHSGATGATGSNTISTATDIDLTTPLGVATNGYTLIYNSTSGKWVPTPTSITASDTYPSPLIAATSNNNASPRILTQVNVPALPFNWRPRCFGGTTVNGALLTRVDLIARLNDSTSGDQVGYSKGQQGAAPPPNILIPGYPGGSSAPGSFGRVLAGNAATIYLVAEQKSNTNGSWSTPASPDTWFQVEVQPVS